MASSAEATASQRRKSGRAVKVPDKFQPEVESSQNASAGGKRKRSGDDMEGVENEEEQEEEEDESEEEDEDEESEEEEAPVKKKSKPKAVATKSAPVAKKAKVNGSAPQPKAHSMRLPSRAKKPTGKVVFKDNDAEGLYAEIFTSDKSSKDVATQWLGEYDADNTAAMADLVNCVLKCAGCDIKVTEDDINDPDNSPNRLNEIQDEHKEKNVADYPLISKAKSSHAFKVCLTDFFESLMGLMHSTTVLYEDIALIENIHLWITSMSSSFLRPFRHTATVIALACATGLCEVAKSQVQNTADMLTLMEKEEKLGSKANKGRLATYQKNIDKGKQHRETSEGTIKDFFDTVFVHRYRDVDPKIRTDCVEALGQWILILPTTFYEGTFLRYLGWLLSDQNGPTRHEVIKQLERIMKYGELGGIRNFIDRFRSRIVEMATKDAETTVRASAVDLLDMIREKGMLEPDDIDIIGKLIFDSDIRVRKSVVNFFAANIEDLYESKIEDLGGEEALDEAFTLDDENKENPCSGWIKLKALAEVLLNYDDGDAVDEGSSQDDDLVISDGTINAAGFESRYSLAAEVLYDKVSELQDWEMLTGYLLFDHSNKQKAGSVSVAVRSAFKLEEKEEVALLEILHAVVKTHLARLGEDHHQKKKVGKSASRVDEDSTARKLAAVLPRLLKLFGSKPKTSTAVLRLEHVLNLGIFQELRQDSTAYATLLHEIKSQFKSHADAHVLREASVALLHAQAFEELGETTEDQMQSLWVDTIDDLRKRFPKSTEISVRGDTKVELVLQLTTTVTRLNRLAGISNPVELFEKAPKKTAKGDRASTMPVIDMLLELVGRGFLDTPDPDIDDEEDKLVISAIQTALFYFMWKGRALKEAVGNAEEVPDVDVDEIKERTETFSDKLISTLSSRAGLDPCRLQATGSLLDLYTIFRSILTSKKAEAALAENDFSHLLTLVRHVAPEVQEEITSIFATAEKHYANKAHKTLEPPADNDDPEDIDSDPEDDDEGLTDAERQVDGLKAELQLCDLTSKLVLAIYARVIDAEGAMEGKLKHRMLRNKRRLGANIAQILAVLEEPNPKKGKKSKSSGGKKPKESEVRAKMKSLEIVVDDDEDEDEEEVDEEERRRQELIDEEGPPSADEADEQMVEEEDEEILGD
ncbi:hypothetical protein VF21_04167 [Pseudogymnoascus sp. 05NY08]|nr:hypothetical protein VF21_04167 [Pseudogymnoascus sp. 05NY08]